MIGNLVLAALLLWMLHREVRARRLRRIERRAILRLRPAYAISQDFIELYDRELDRRARDLRYWDRSR